MAEKILLVDDDRVNLDVLSRYLGINGYDVEKATDGLHAIHTIENQNIDIVVSDIVMPNVDGLLLATYIKVHYPTTPVILMTGNAPERTIEIAERAGAKHLLIKPLQLHELLKKIIQTLALREL